MIILGFRDLRLKVWGFEFRGSGELGFEVFGPRRSGRSIYSAVTCWRLLHALSNFLILRLGFEYIRGHILRIPLSSWAGHELRVSVEVGGPCDYSTLVGLEKTVLLSQNLEQNRQRDQRARYEPFARPSTNELPITREISSGEPKH